MESAAFRLQEHGASFTFSDGHREEISRQLVDQSSVIQDLLFEGREQQDVTVTAPRMYLRTWSRLHNLLATSDKLDGVSADELAAFLKVTDFFSDHCSMSKVQLALAAQLFQTPPVPREIEPHPVLQKRRRPVLSHAASTAIGRLHEDLVTSVLRAALDHHLATFNDLIRLIPRPLVVSAVRSAFSASPIHGNWRSAAVRCAFPASSMNEQWRATA